MYNLNNLFETLKRKNLQQKDLAAYLGTSPSVISDWKIGRIKPSIDDIVRSAEFLGESIDYLLGCENGSNYIMRYGTVSGNEQIYKIDFSKIFNSTNRFTVYMSYLWEARNKLQRLNVLSRNTMLLHNDDFMAMLEYLIYTVDEALDLIVLKLDELKSYSDVVNFLKNDDTLKSLFENVDVFNTKSVQNMFSNVRNMLGHLDHERTEAYKKFYESAKAYPVIFTNGIPSDHFKPIILEIIKKEYLKIHPEHANKSEDDIFSLFLDLLKVITETYSFLLEAILKKFFSEYTNWNEAKNNPDITITLKSDIDIKIFNINSIPNPDFDLGIAAQFKESDASTHQIAAYGEGYVSESDENGEGEEIK